MAPPPRRKGRPLRVLHKKQRSMSYLSLIKAKDAPFAPTGRKTTIVKSTRCRLSAKQRPARTPPSAFRALRARNSPPHPSVADFRVTRRKIILTVISNDMRVGNDSSPQVTVGFYGRRAEFCRHSGLQSPSKMKGNGKAVPFRFICTILSPPVPSSWRHWGGSLPSLKPVRMPSR